MSASDFARLGFPYYDAAGNFISNDGEKQMQAAQESRRKSNGEEEMEAKERQAKEAQKGENALQEHHQHHHNNNNNSGESTVSRHLAVLTPGRRLASCIAQSKPGPSPHEAAASQHSQRGEQMRQRAKARGSPPSGGLYHEFAGNHWSYGDRAYTGYRAWLLHGMDPCPDRGAASGGAGGAASGGAGGAASGGAGGAASGGAGGASGSVEGGPRTRTYEEWERWCYGGQGKKRTQRQRKRVEDWQAWNLMSAEERREALIAGRVGVQSGAGKFVRAS